MDDFEFSWDFGEASELRKQKTEVEKELGLYKSWTFHHRDCLSVAYKKKHELREKIERVKKDIDTL